jgi:multiple sugar transport system permease protein
MTAANSTPAPPVTRSSSVRPWSRRLPRILVMICLVLIAAVSLFPLYWLFITALTPASSTVKLPPEMIPTHPTLDNLERIIRVSGAGKLRLIGESIVTMPRLLLWFINTAVIAIFSTGVHVLFDSMAGYAFAKRRFPGSNLFFYMILAALMIPAQVTLVPLYLMVTKFKLINTFAGVVMPGLADVIGIFLLKQYIQTLPSELIEAARIDGASEWGAFTRIVLPLSAPGLAVTAIFAFQRYWNSFLWPLVVLQSPDKFTLQVGLSFVNTSEFGTDYGLLMSGAALAAIPMILFFFAFQKYFMQGLRIGAVKG